MRDCATPGIRNEVVVVDNASADGSAEMVRNEHPDVRLIVNETNEGLARANNRAIRATSSDYVLLLNSDAQLTPGCLDALVARLDGDPRAAAAGPRLVYEDGRFQRWTAGRTPTFGSVASYLLLLDRASKGRPPFEGVFLARDVREPFRPDWVSNACALYRRSALEQVGLLNEELFLYMDDVDVCGRLRAAGWDVWYEPSAVAVHLMGQSAASAKDARPPRDALPALNRWVERTQGKAAAVALRAVESVAFAARAAAYAGVAATRKDEGARRNARVHWAHARLAWERGDG